jgi:lysophospholipase L1-like esterase
MTRERLGSIYRTASLLLINSVVLLVLLELLSGLVLSYRLSRGMEAWSGLEYYQNQPWGEQYWREARFIFEGDPVDYHPFVLWRRTPFSGETINVDQDGIRTTPGSECIPGAYTVFAFGGSAMWGFGAPDWATIPAFIQEALEADQKGPVCLVNYAEPAFVSTQSLIQLEAALQQGKRPDAVVFLEGANDVIAAFQTGQAGGHHNQASIGRKLESGSRPLVNALQSSRIFELLRVLVAARIQQDYVDFGAEAGSLGDQVAGVYLENIEIVQSLADRYGFQPYFFWQPVLPAADKSLTLEERDMLAGMDSAEIELFLEANEAIAARAAGVSNLVLLTHVFDGQTAALWIDPLHFTPEGNRIVAQEILRQLHAE